MAASDDKIMTMKEAISEAKRCLNCAKPLCKKGCPIENNIPEFIHELSKGNLGTARELIAEKSNLPAVCGRVCAHEKQCGGACVLNKSGNPVRIGDLEKFVADFDMDMGIIRDNIKPKNRGKVAIIGSGPAGLTTAGDLAREGFNVVVFEAESQPGGVLLYGIPSFRLSKDVVAREIARIESLGVTFMNNVMIGSDMTIDDMLKQGFDAVFIGTGTALSKELDIPGKEMHGIIQSSYFLRIVSLYNSGQVLRDEVPVDYGDEVLIIGAGNVAMDAARTAKRMNAKSVTVIYRKTEAELTCLRSEYESAVNDNVKFEWLSTPVEYIGENRIITGLKVKTNDDERVIPANKILIAIGQKPANRIVSTTKGIDVNELGYVITKPRPYGMTTLKGVFAGGDVVHQPATVVLAMKEAKKVAQGIIAYVDAKKLLDE